MLNVYDVGDLLPITITFTTSTGQAVNPSTVSFQYSKPDGTEVTKTYPGDTEITRTSTGVYTMSLSIDTAGPWYYRWFSTGTGQAAQRGSFDAVTYKP